MKTIVLLILISTVVGGMVASCGRVSGGGDVAVVDLAAVAKATGDDKVMDEQVAAARKALGTQLTTIAGELDKELQAEQSRLGGAAAASREKDFQQLTAQARQKLLQTQALAEQKAQDFQLGLVARYRDAVRPVAAEIAQSRKARVVLVSDPTMLWFDSNADITGEVIAELRAHPIKLPAPALGKAADSSSGAKSQN